MKVLGLGVGMLLAGFLSAQTNKTDTTNQPLNSAQNVLNNTSNKNFTIGGYGQIDYNQGFNDSTSTNGKLDVHRMVVFMGYKFNDRVDFVTELEFEHVKEVYVEQAFLDYSFSSAFNVKAGIILIPMGYVNEFHEPTLFNGVDSGIKIVDLKPNLAE